VNAAPVRAVLFDAAGTLIHLRESVGETYARAGRRFGMHLRAERVAEAFARAMASAPPMVFPDAPGAQSDPHERAWWRDRVHATFRAAAPDDPLTGFGACFDALYTEFSESSAWAPAPAARDTLAALSGQGLATAVVSNFDRRLPRLLEDLGLAPLLDAVVLPSDAGAAKPDPAIFHAALERLGCPAEAAVHVGDHPAEDVAGATAAGLRAIDVRELATLADLPARLSPPTIAAIDSRPAE